MAGEQFSLVWNSFPRNLSSGLYTLLTDEQLVDVTLAADGQILRAHKLILSVCSTYFKEIFKMNSCKHPIVILKDVNYRDLSAMLHFMYQGEVNIKQEDLASFLKVAETLQIKGLTKENTERDNNFAVINQDLSHLRENADEKSSEVLERFLETEASLAPTCLVVENEKSVQLEEGLSEVADTSEPISSPQDSLLITGPNLAVHNEASARRETRNEPDSIIREILSNKSEEFEERISQSDDEPLDYTSDIGKLTDTKNEPADYASDIDFDAVCNKDYRSQDNHGDNHDNRMNTENNPDCIPNSQILTYNSCHRDKPVTFSHLEPSFHGDFGYENSSYKEGRKTMKGIGGDSVPLETTLRVVSELGPTLRVERGKVMRMYSCPWCLRHFTRKENLKLHVRYIHGPLESLTCKLCGNKYKNSNSLRVHSYLYHNTKRNKHDKTGIVGSSM